MNAPCNATNAVRGNLRQAGRRVALASAVATLFVSGVVSAQASETTGEYVKGRVIVGARAGLADAEVGRIVKGHGAQAKRIGKTDLYIVELPQAGSEVALKNLLARNPQFKFAELDAVFRPTLVPNDPYLGSQWHLSKIGAPTAWDQSTGTSVTVAVLDSGIDTNHPDIRDRLVSGWNFFNNSSDVTDINGHGTAVAGAAAASFNNGTGVASIAGNAKIMPLRVTDANGAATGSMIAQALTWAADRGARVANISYGGVPGNSTVQSAAQYMKTKGGLVIVSSGNTGTDLGLPPETTMIPVAATDANDVRASWSSYGDYVALAAPGVGIWTTQKGGGYFSASGTSVASPVVAGTVALMMSARPDLAPAQVEGLLYSTATDLGAAGRDVYYGYGRVDAASAVAAAKAAAVADTQAPTIGINYPTAGTTVSGLVAVDVGASDNVGVVKVELRVNGQVQASDTASPYQFSWDSTKVANGAYALTATAYDAAGNAKTSSSVGVTVANGAAADSIAPVVAITSPTDGSRLAAGTVTVSVQASDNAGAAGIRNALYINGSLVASGTGSSLSYKWNTRKLKSGIYTIDAVASDAAGNSATFTVKVNY